MRAVVTSPFPGVKDGEIYPVDLAPGDEIDGDLARTAVAAGNADVTEEDDAETVDALRRDVVPLPPQPNNPPSLAAYGLAGTPSVPLALAQPSEGTETSLPALATEDLGASTVEGPDTPTGGKLDEETMDGKSETPPENGNAADLVEHGDGAASAEQPSADHLVEGTTAPAGRRKK